MESMKEIQEELFQCIQYLNDSDRAKEILSDHPEIVTAEWIGGNEIEDSTLLIDACRHGESLSVSISLKTLIG